MTMTKTERTELRSLIRQRFRVLRTEVDARRAELEEQLRADINRHFADADKAWDDAMYLIGEAVREANRKANDILRAVAEAGPLYPDGQHRDHRLVQATTVVRPANGHTEMARAGLARIETRVKAARLRLEREEADLLTRLVEGAMQSEEARTFLRTIPTVSELVPADRLLALEQGLQEA
jgi:hypothetical protein